VEEYLQLLEAGKPLPPSPRESGRPKESARSFLARMDALQARYDAQFLKYKDLEASHSIPDRAGPTELPCSRICAAGLLLTAVLCCAML
jgi:hypothetical protein